MKITVTDWRGTHEVWLPLKDIPHQGVFDSAGKCIMKYYDQTGRSDWLVSPDKIINELYDQLIVK